MVQYKNSLVPFSSVISSGTKMLWLFFCWKTHFDKVTFLFIDEFDAYFHYETAEYIYKLICKYSNCQSVVTSHNTYLMQNDLTRPDCVYIASDNRSLTPLCDCREKEIREAHNLEKIYISGGFGFTN